MTNFYNYQMKSQKKQQYFNSTICDIYLRDIFTSNSNINKKERQLNTMRPLLMIVMASLQIFVFSINQYCVNATNCPTQAYCSNNYCICNSGYIGNCNTPAQIISSSSVPAVLNSSQTTYFSVNPQVLDHYIQFTFSICLNSSLQLTFLLWGDTGDITSFNSNDALASSSSFTMVNGCNLLKTTSFTFGQQPNGQNDLLILGITNNDISTNIQISVTQKKIMALNLYEYILIALVIFIGLSIIVAAVTFLIRRRRRNANRGDSTSALQTTMRIKSNYNDIEHFDSFMPIFPAVNLCGQLINCPICLQQIQEVEVVRRTPCKHIFHSSCLDAWCLKNISCPVCRRDFSFNSLNEPRKSRTAQILSDPKYQISWEQQQQEEPTSKRQNLQIQTSH